MRVPALLLCVVCTALSYQALAVEPKPASSGPLQTAPTAAEPQTAAPAAGAQNTATPAPSASAPAESKTAATTDSSKIELTREEHDLISRGYKVEMRHGQKWFCKREGELGSHFEVKNCNSAESIQARHDASVETIREMQAIKPEINK